MTKIILEPENQGDLMLIKDLAERLNIKYKLESIDKEKRKNI